MISITKHQLLEAYFPLNKMNPQYWKLWLNSLSELMINSHSDPISLFTIGPNKARSIGYDVGKIEKEGRFNGVDYLVTGLNDFTLEQIKMIVETDEFYLGFILLVVGTLNEEHIQQIIIHQDRELVKAGVECFKMDSDGMCFYWYNPASIEKATKLFEQLGDKIFLE